MDIDTDRIGCRAGLAVAGPARGHRAYAGCSWDAMNRLHEKGFISDPVGKAKPVVFSEEGQRRSEELFRQMFGRE